MLFAPISELMSKKYINEADPYFKFFRNRHEISFQKLSK